LDSPEGELSILIVDDPRIEVFNREYLNREKPTNVISFPMREGSFDSISPGLLGDVVISIETAEREAQQGGMDLEERFTQLLVHGILHLFGYDHETCDEDAQNMEIRASELLGVTLDMQRVCPHMRA
jgi:probable rRNA maturation factor